MTTEEEVRKINKNLSLFLAEFQDVKERKKMIKKASKVMVNGIKSKAPVASQPIKRYGKVAKLNEGIRAPKGFGNVVEIIEPGRLRDSIGFIPLRRTSEIYIGPRGMRKKTGAPYYAAWMEFGAPGAGIDKQPYMRPGFENTKGIVYNNIANEYKKKVSDFKPK